MGFLACFVGWGLVFLDFFECGARMFVCVGLQIIFVGIGLPFWWVDSSLGFLGFCLLVGFWGVTLNGEFDPGSGRTLAACLTHASRAERPLRGYSSGERVSNT
jgi:hypothetical protein